MTLDLLGSVEAVLALTAAAGGLFLLLRKVGRGIRKVAHFLDSTGPRAIRAIDEVIGEDGDPSIRGQLATITHELFPNGGGSLRDAVNHLRDRAEEAVDGVAELTAHLGRAEHTGSRERHEMRDILLNVVGALELAREDQRAREAAYVEALAEAGIDLRGVTEHLNRQERDGG